MGYYFNTRVRGVSFDEAVQFLEEELRKEGFGVISEIDIRKAFRTRLGMEYRKYTIIGAFNPAYTYRALHSNDKSGLFLPCNFIVQETEDHEIEIAAIDPTSLVKATKDENLNLIANQMQRKIRLVIRNLGLSKIRFRSATRHSATSSIS